MEKKNTWCPLTEGNQELQKLKGLKNTKETRNQKGTPGKHIIT